MDASAITGLFTLGGAFVGVIGGGVLKIVGDSIHAKRDREVKSEQRRDEFQRRQREQVLLMMINGAKTASLYTAKAIGKNQDARDADPDVRHTAADLQGWLIALATVYPFPAHDPANKIYL